MAHSRVRVRVVRATMRNRDPAKGIRKMRASGASGRQGSCVGRDTSGAVLSAGTPTRAWRASNRCPQCACICSCIASACETRRRKLLFPQSVLVSGRLSPLILWSIDAYGGNDNTSVSSAHGTAPAWGGRSILSCNLIPCSDCDATRSFLIGHASAARASLECPQSGYGVSGRREV